MYSPLISFCIANYNKAAFIEQCLDSILFIETYPNKEIVIVDDCSTDNSIEIIQNWIQKHKWDIAITFLKNTKNSGPWFSYNDTTLHAHGEFIVFMDSDDFFISPSFTKKIEIFKERQSLKVMYGNAFFYEENKLQDTEIHTNILHTFEKHKNNPQDILMDIFVKIPLLSLSGALIRKDFFLNTGGFDPDIFSNDYIGNIKIFSHLENSEEFTIIRAPNFAYRIYKDNLSKDFDKILHMLLEVTKKYCPPNLQKKAFANVYFTNTLSNLSIWNYKKGVVSMRKSMGDSVELKKIALFSMSIIFPTKIILKLFPKSFIYWLKSTILRVFQ